MKSVVKTYISLDRKRRLRIFDNQDGFFTFEETREVIDDIPGYGPDIQWWLCYQSGLYESLGEAVSDALATMPWLREAM
jgi:hypothetical protein